MEYTEKVKSRNIILLSTTCGYQHYTKKTGFDVRDKFSQYYFASPVLHNILHHLFAWKIYHFTCLHIPEVDIVHIENYNYDKYFGIDARGK